MALIWKVYFLYRMPWKSTCWAWYNWSHSLSMYFCVIYTFLRRVRVLFSYWRVCNATMWGLIRFRKQKHMFVSSNLCGNSWRCKFMGEFIWVKSHQICYTDKKTQSVVRKILQVKHATWLFLILLKHILLNETTSVFNTCEQNYSCSRFRVFGFCHGSKCQNCHF